MMQILTRRAAAIHCVACVAAFAWGCGARTDPAQVVTPPDQTPPVATTPSPAQAAPDAPDRGRCALFPEPGAPITTIGLSERVDPANAPSPTNDSERVLFRQVYESLLQIDCEGRVSSTLAAAWRSEDGGRSWIVSLRDDVRFADGAPLTASDVIASWSAAAGGGLRPRVSRYLESAVAIDERALTIVLRRSTVAEAPVILAHHDLAVARRSPGLPWPIGTRPIRVAPGTARPDASGRSIITLVASAGRQGAVTPEMPLLRITVAPGRDPRDLLDEGVDLLLTKDRAALDYAATLPHYRTVALGWRSTHVFVAARRRVPAGALSVDARQTLAVDAIRGEARAAEGPFWWETMAECEVPAARAANPSEAPRIVYDSGDAASRDLAERIVGLATSPGGRAGSPASGHTAEILNALAPGSPGQAFQRAIGLTGDGLMAAQSRGADAGYVTTLDRDPLDPCLEWRGVAERMPWLMPDAVVPLVETRLRAVVRRDRLSPVAERDGLLVETAGER